MKKLGFIFAAGMSTLYGAVEPIIAAARDGDMQTVQATLGFPTVGITSLALPRPSLEVRHQAFIAAAGAGQNDVVSFMSGGSARFPVVDEVTWQDALRVAIENSQISIVRYILQRAKEPSSLWMAYRGEQFHITPIAVVAGFCPLSTSAEINVLLDEYLSTTAYLLERARFVIEARVRFMTPCSLV
jgi:hypothetical protein